VLLFRGESAARLAVAMATPDPNRRCAATDLATGRAVFWVDERRAISGNNFRRPLAVSLSSGEVVCLALDRKPQ
jgi:hypothetical protein